MTQIILPESDARVLNTLIRVGRISRTEIADLTGYSRAKITSVINTLMAQGYLVESGSGPSSGGRKSRLLSFTSDMGYVIGVDMGATSVDIALSDFNREIIARYGEDIDVRDGPVLVLDRIAKIILEIIEDHRITPAQVRGIGIGVPGPVEFANGVLIAPPIMPGWEAYPIRNKLHETFPNATVTVDNDVNVMALGELRSGAGIDVENFMFIKIGTGIGCGIVAHREIYRGSTGCAGDVGHIRADSNGPTCHCGNVGCLEAMAGGAAIARQAMEVAQSGKSPALQKYLKETGRELTAVDIGRAAAEGDQTANEIIQVSGTLIGEVLAGLVNFFNPSLILIGGGVSHIGYHLLSSIRQGILSRSLPLSTRHLQIDYSTIGTDCGVLGTLSLGAEHIIISE